MNQPELGKKISDLRKTKGLTQEELAAKCNINVRTLQRVEYGEVTPRSYTIKLIFAALDYSLNGSFLKTEFVILIWLGQLYRNFIDLFNLKTNKMKKITILTIMISVIIFGLFALFTESRAQKDNKANIQVTDKNASEKTPSVKMVFSNFSCGACFEENNEMTGRDVKFKNNGVSVNVRLIKLNKTTREFNVGFVKGKLFQNKVEVICAQDMLNDGSVKYTAGRIEKSTDKISLKGNAKLTSSQNENIETDEIIITTN